VDVEGTKGTPELLLLLGTDVLEVLVAEDDDDPLGDQERELVLLSAVEPRQLKAPDLGSDDRGQLCRLDLRVALGQEVGLLPAYCEPAVVELERLQRSE